MPFKEIHSLEHKLNLYAATKKSNEILGNYYSHLFQIQSTATS